jgi:hypothetical protein
MGCWLGSEQEWGKTYLCIGENGWRDNFVRAKRLSRVDEGTEDLCAFLAFGWAFVSSAVSCSSGGQSWSVGQACRG